VPSGTYWPRHCAIRIWPMFPSHGAHYLSAAGISAAQCWCDIMSWAHFVQTNYFPGWKNHDDVETILTRAKQRALDRKASLCRRALRRRPLRCCGRIRPQRWLTCAPRPSVLGGARPGRRDDRMDELSRRGAQSGFSRANSRPAFRQRLRRFCSCAAPATGRITLRRSRPSRLPGLLQRARGLRG